jgi:hypothetical protein
MTMSTQVEMVAGAPWLPTFDFVSDRRFRESLISDYREVIRSIDSGSWKAVHVLAGSIIEALLVDYLLATASTSTRKSGDPLKMELAEAIETCRKEGILSQKAAELSSVVRGYRNLIHPGRVVRLCEKINADTGRIAMSLVNVVVDEVAVARAEKCGFTAEQIVNKLEKDSSALSVLSHFLKETSDYERERLLTDVIPERYFADHEDPSDYPHNLEVCFRKVFETLSDERKALVTKRFIKILKESDQDTVFAYETAFFRGRDLKYLNKGDALLAKQHLLSRLQEKPTPKLITALQGVGRYLSLDEVVSTADALIKAAAYGKYEAIRKAGHTGMSRLWAELPSKTDQMNDSDVSDTVLLKRVEVWIRFWEEKNMLGEVEIGKRLLSELDIPF